jgi:hypothetical protein
LPCQWSDVMQQGAPLLMLTELGLIEFLARFVHASLVHLSETLSPWYETGGLQIVCILAP